LSAQDTSKPALSSVPLTSAQIAVYQAFLADYMKDSKRKLNLADMTGTFQPDDGDLSGCMKDFTRSSSALKVHTLTQALGQNQYVRLVDGETYKVDDPWDRIKKGQSVDSAVEAGFAAGLLSLSEVIFDKTGQFAAFNYGFR
jgi:hypothetical protein